MYEHKEADRVPIFDCPWGSTVERWRREGLPADADIGRFFGMDQFAGVGVDNSPRYPYRLIEETDEYTITTSGWGATQKNLKHAGGVPEFLDFTVVDADSWREAKKRMQPDADRLDWGGLEKNYAQWRKDGAWISAYFWFGFDVTHSWMVGTERVLINMATDPEWLVDIWNHMLDIDMALFQMALDRGYTFDAIGWPDDMGYKLNQFFSLDMYRNLLKPVHKRACDWAHTRGMKVHLHSCGDIRPFVPELIDIGVDMLNPLEVKAGVDPATLKKQYGDKLAFHGGLNAVLYNTPEQMWEEMRRVIPVMKENGGYIISTDHSVPDSVSLDTFKQFMSLARDLGKYF